MICYLKGKFTKKIKGLDAARPDKPSRRTTHSRRKGSRVGTIFFKKI
jgi:hypothetical protein